MNVANALEIANFLRQCDQQFVPPLSSRVEIADYSSKIALSGERFEAWSGPSLVGLVAAYCNDAGRREAFITNVSILPEWTARGLGTQLLRMCIGHAEQAGFRLLSLEVDVGNEGAIRLYKLCGFKAGLQRGSAQLMHLLVGAKEE